MNAVYNLYKSANSRHSSQNFKVFNQHKIPIKSYDKFEQELTTNIYCRFFERLISKWSAFINEAKFEIKLYSYFHCIFFDNYYVHFKKPVKISQHLLQDSVTFFPILSAGSRIGFHKILSAGACNNYLLYYIHANIKVTFSTSLFVVNSLHTNYSLCHIWVQTKIFHWIPGHLQWPYNLHVIEHDFIRAQLLWLSSEITAPNVNERSKMSGYAI